MQLLDLQPTYLDGERRITPVTYIARHIHQSVWDHLRDDLREPVDDRMETVWRPLWNAFWRPLNERWEI